MNTNTVFVTTKNRIVHPNGVNVINENTTVELADVSPNIAFQKRKFFLRDGKLLFPTTRDNLAIA